MTIFQLLHLVDLTSLVASHLQVCCPIPEPILTLPSLSSHICVGEFVEIIGDLEGVFVVTDVGERVEQLEQVLKQFVITILLLLQIFLISFSFDKLANKLAQDTSVSFLSISNRFVLSSHNGAEVGPSDVGKEVGLLVGTLVGYGVGLFEPAHVVHVL